MIKYICISDLHLGEEDSLFTNLEKEKDKVDPLRPSKVAQLFSECIYEILKNQKEPPTLIILGDGLELALSTLNISAMVFERFLEVTSGLFKKIIYIPGNHDHHIWEVAREVQYAEYIKRKHSWGSYLPQAWHHTGMIDGISYRPLEPVFMNSLISRNEKFGDIPIWIAYPNFCLMDREKKRAIFFHHGHLTEKLYLLMSIIRRVLFQDLSIEKAIEDIYSMSIDEIEGENFAWIDFFWSSMGREKKVGEKVESIYEKLQVAESFKDLIGRIAKALSKIYDIPWIPGDFLEEKVLRKVLSLLLRKAKQERGYSKKALSKDAEKCLKAYISGPLLRQFREEAEDDPDQYDITFIFGHTHKPFSDFIKAGKRIKVYNTGGWTVDTIYPNPLYGGSVIFIDEGLNVISFNMFLQGVHSFPSIKELSSPDEEESSLYRLFSEIQFEKGSWKRFSSTVQNAISIRACYMKERVLS